MIKHVVMWRFSKKENADTVKTNLEGLKGRIPTLSDIEVGSNINGSEAAFDLVLITTHPDVAGLEAYQVHPLHKDVGKIVAGFGPERVVVDFEF